MQQCNICLDDVDEDGAPLQALLDALDDAASAPRHVLLQNCDDDEDGGAAFGIESSAKSFSARGSGDLRAPPAAPAAVLPRRSGHAPAPRVIADAPDETSTARRRSSARSGAS